MPTKFPKHSDSERGHRKYLGQGSNEQGVQYTKNRVASTPDKPEVIFLSFKPSTNSRLVLSILSTTCVIRVSTEVDSSTLRNRFSLSDLSWLSRSWFLLVYIYSSKPTTQLLCGKLKGNVSVQNLEMLLKIERNNMAQCNNTVKFLFCLVTVSKLYCHIAFIID